MLIPDPCFISLLERGTGPRRIRVRVANPGETLSLHVTDVVKPEWLEVESAHHGDTVLFPGHGVEVLVVNINTDHRFFPAVANISEQIEVVFADHPILRLQLHILTVREPQPFRGVFAIDFGTTNTCWSWKARAGDRVTISDLMASPRVSRVHPSVIRFRDLSVPTAPVVDVGFKARDAISLSPAGSPTWLVSVKRLLGTKRAVTVADERAGLEPGRYLRLQPHEIAGIMIREFVREAEGELGQRIDRVAATYPVTFTQQRIEELRLAFRAAFVGLNRPLADDALTLVMDETNAAAFAFVHDRLLEDFKRTTATTAHHRLLVIDIGGGTTDVAVLDADLTRDAMGRISMRTAVAGATGEPAWGGDNATLAVLHLLRARLALRIAKQRVSPRSEPVAQLSKAPIPADPFAALAVELAASDIATSSSSGQAVANDPLLRGVMVADADPARRDRFLAACRLLVDHAAVVENACERGLDLAAAVKELSAKGVLKVAWYQGRELHEALDEALATVVPTRWESGDLNDLEQVETARALFHELWHPAETLKIRLSMEHATQAELTEPLPRTAWHAGVPVTSLAGIEVRRSELEAAIGPRLRRIVARAAWLAEHVDSAAAEGPFALPPGPVAVRPTTVLLAGNGSRPPLVRRLVEELCGVPSQAVVADPQPKTLVARGACAEQAMARDFGGGDGLLSFTPVLAHGALPYSIGLFHPQLAIHGFPGGFVPLLPRRALVGSEVVLTRTIPLLHQRARELMLFAYYHDHDLTVERGSRSDLEGIEPATLGWFDLMHPEALRWSKPFNHETNQQLTSLTPEDGALVLHLEENRVPVLVRPSDRACFELRGVDEAGNEADDPFCGRW